MQRNNTAIDQETAALLGVSAPTPPNNIVPLNSGDPLAALDAIGTESATKGGSVYPVLPDPDGSAAALARTSIELADAKEKLETNNRLLGEKALRFFFQYWAGKPDFESSIKVKSEIGNVLVTCMKKARKMESASVLAAIAALLKRDGRDLEKELFYTTFDITIDGEQIPPAVITPLITELAALFQKYGCAKALSKKKTFKPYPAFYSQRMVLFTPAENEQIQAAVPIVTMVKTKNIK